MQVQYKINYLLFLFLIGMLFFSCDKNNRTETLKRAYSKLNDNPKQALDLLEAIPEPETMDEADYMLFILVKTDAKLKNKQDVTGDTLIYAAQHFYNEKNNPLKAALANYTAGDVSYDRGTYDKALGSYLKAEYFARKINDNLTIARSLHSIGNLYFIQQSMDSAIIHYKDADSYYTKTEDTKRKRLLLCQQIGRTYDNVNSMDSALVYYDKGYLLAKELNDKEFQTTFTHLLGIVWRKKEDYNQSEKYLNKALSETTDEEEKLKIHLSLARLYIKLDKLNLAQSHINEIKSGLSKIKGNIGLKSIYTSLVDFYDLNADYQEARYYDRLIAKIDLQISEKNGLEELIAVEKKHQSHIKDIEAAENLRLLKITLGVGIGLTLLIILIMLLVLRNNRLKREKEKERNKLLAAENKLLHTDNELSNSENELLKQRSGNFLFLHNICRHIIHDWANIDRDMKQYALEQGGAETEPEVYQKIKQTIDSIKLKAKEHLIETAKTHLLNLGVEDKTISGLTDMQLLIFILDRYRYRKADILEMISLGGDIMDEDDLNHEMYIILAKLKKYGIITRLTNPLIFRRRNKFD